MHHPNLSCPPLTAHSDTVPTLRSVRTTATGTMLTVLATIRTPPVGERSANTRLIYASTPPAWYTHSAQLGQIGAVFALHLALLLWLNDFTTAKPLPITPPAPASVMITLSSPEPAAAPASDTIAAAEPSPVTAPPESEPEPEPSPTPIPEPPPPPAIIPEPTPTPPPPKPVVKPQPPKPKPVVKLKPTPKPAKPVVPRPVAEAKPVTAPVNSTPAPTASAGRSAPAATSATSGGETRQASANAAYLRNPAPEYPEAARRRGEHGQVLLRVQVSREGRALQQMVQRSSGYERLDQSALRAVSRWRFVPALQNGQPTEAWVLIPINFTLERN